MGKNPKGDKIDFCFALDSSVLAQAPGPEIQPFRMFWYY